MYWVEGKMRVECARVWNGVRPCRGGGAGAPSRVGLGRGRGSKAEPGLGYL